jgi:hypothetical protein
VSDPAEPAPAAEWVCSMPVQRKPKLRPGRVWVCFSCGQSLGTRAARPFCRECDELILGVAPEAAPDDRR